MGFKMLGRQTSEPFEPSSFEVDIVLSKLQRFESPAIDSGRFEVLMVVNILICCPLVCDSM